MSDFFQTWLFRCFFQVWKCWVFLPFYRLDHYKKKEAKNAEWLFFVSLFFSRLVCPIKLGHDTRKRGQGQKKQ